MQVILGIIVFGLIAIAIIVILVINFMYRNVKRLREDAEDFLYRRGKRNEQKERNPFGEDYFALVAIIARPMALLNKKPLVEQLQAVV